MKDRIVIEIPKDMCDNCNGCDKPTSALVECYLDEPRQVYETVKVPENWEELKSLCKDIKDIQIVSNVIYLEPEDLGRIELYSDGVIVCNEYILAENRTVAQMWNFIKSLMEKEDVLL